MNIINMYKTMPEMHKKNLKSYYICDGIYSCYPDISDEDATFIYEVCKKIGNENINPFSISFYLTDNFSKGNLTKEQIKNASSGEICEAVYFDNLNYFSSISNDEVEINI